MFTSVFGISIKYEAWNHQDSLPVYIVGSYDFQTAYIGNRRCIMLAPIEELATLPALKKQIAKIQQIAYIFDKWGANFPIYLLFFKAPSI